MAYLSIVSSIENPSAIASLAETISTMNASDSMDLPSGLASAATARYTTMSPTSRPNDIRFNVPVPDH